MQSKSKFGKSGITLVALLMCSLILFSSASIFKKGPKESEFKADTLALTDLNETATDIEALASENTYSDFDKSKIQKITVKDKRDSDLSISVNLPKKALKEIVSTLLYLPNVEFVQNTIQKDTLDEEERAEVRRQLEEKKSKYKEKSKELKQKVKEAGEKIKAEYKDDLREARKEYEELKKQLGEEKRSYHSDREIDFDFDEEDLEEFAEKMSAWGERFGEGIAETFDEEWAHDMEKWGKEFGEKFQEKFGDDFGDRWSRKFENMGEEFSEIFDEEWLAEISEIGTEVAESFDEEWLEGIGEMSQEITEIVEEAFEHIDEDNITYDLSLGDVDNGGALKQTLAEALATDGLLDYGRNVTIITDDKMTVNGDRQPQDRLERYQDLIRQSQDKAFRGEKTKVKFVMRGKNIDNSSKTSISVSIED